MTAREAVPRQAAAHVLVPSPETPPRLSAIDGMSTFEVRWILQGQLDAAVSGWLGRFPCGMDSREDAYLMNPVLRGLSVKIRAGQLLEVKQYDGSPGILDIAGLARGRIESWRKWSFPFGPLGPNDAGTPGWTVLLKRRQMSRFRLAVATETACMVELTEVRVGGETWWTLGFEATGPAGSLRGTLQSTAALVFDQSPPGDVEFDMNHCQSYAEWLSRRRVLSVRADETGTSPVAATGGEAG
jgi:hypothetical protein